MTRRKLLSLPFLAPVAKALGMGPPSSGIKWVDFDPKMLAKFAWQTPRDMDFYQIGPDGELIDFNAVNREIERVGMTAHKPATWEYFISPGAFDLKSPTD